MFNSQEKERGTRVGVFWAQQKAHTDTRPSSTHPRCDSSEGSIECDEVPATRCSEGLLSPRPFVSFCHVTANPPPVPIVAFVLSPSQFLRPLLPSAAEQSPSYPPHSQPNSDVSSLCQDQALAVKRPLAKESRMSS